LNSRPEYRRRRFVLFGALALLAAIPVVALAVALRGGDEGRTVRPASGGPIAGVQPKDGEVEAHPIAGNFKPDERKLEACNGDRGCVEQAFGNMAFYRGPKPALRLFAQQIVSDPAVESNCHRIAHTLGSAALARYKGNVARAFSLGDSTCWSGYYHGILERAFYGLSTEAELGRAARTLCEDPGVRRTTWILYQCVHGLGHGLMIQTGYNLPFALSICDRLATEWDQQSCYGGSFMENVASSYDVESKWVKDDNLIYPCDAVKRKYKTPCYLMVTSRILQETGYAWKKAARLCAKVERNWVRTCFQSYGRDASGFSRQDPVKILELCGVAAVAGAAARAHAQDAVDENVERKVYLAEGECIFGAARDITANYSDGRPAGKFCDMAPRDVRPYCFYGVGTIVAGFGATRAQNRLDCSRITREYRRWCLRGAGIPA
jgi:hypothetical protein